MAQPTAATLPILFKDELNRELICQFCEQALRAPVTTNCGHDFCVQCIQPGMTCNLCQATVESVQKNQAKQKLVQSLLVYCPFRDSTCAWGGLLKMLQAHLANCEFRMETCTICGSVMPVAEFEKHVGECQVVTCEYCESLVKFASFERHLQKCPKVIISCPFQCGLVNVTREEVDCHRYYCSNVKNVCPFVDLGCLFVGEREQIQQHLTTEPVRHLMLMCDETTAIKRYFDLAVGELEDIHKRHEELNQTTRVCEKVYGPQLVWKIDDVLTKMNESKSGAKLLIFSPAFVSGRFGYKLVASANLFGDGTSRGKFMSVYIALIRGEFDPVLEWPFKMSIRFTLLDQNPVAEDRVNVTYTVDSRRLAGQSAQFLGQPIGGRNAAFGAQRFCSLDRLKEYVKNDTLFLQIELDEPTDLAPLRPSFREAIMFDEINDI